MNSDFQQKAADSCAAMGWVVWVTSHIDQINSVLQSILLLVSIVGTLVALRYHYKRTPK